MKKLLYRLVPHNGGAVFAEEDRAMQIAQINLALRSSTTWGDFRRSMPPDEYQRIVARIDFDDDEQTEPEPSDEFDGGRLTEEGEYPDWLQPEMDLVIPDDILKAYGRLETTFLNGSYWHIPEENIEPMADALRAQGYVAERAQDLPFH